MAADEQAAIETEGVAEEHMVPEVAEHAGAEDTTDDARPFSAMSKAERMEWRRVNGLDEFKAKLAAERYGTVPPDPDQPLSSMSRAQRMAWRKNHTREEFIDRLQQEHGSGVDRALRWRGY